LSEPNNQPQSTRRAWENLLQVGDNARTSRIVENRDAGNSGHGFFEQLQPLTAQFPGKDCNASEVAAGTGKALNQACPDRVDPNTRHNDGNCLGRIHGRPDYRGPSCYHDDIDFETHQLGRKLIRPILGSPPAEYRYSIAMFCPSMYPSSRSASRIASA